MLDVPAELLRYLTRLVSAERTALHTRQVVTSFVTYDKRLLEAALAAGLPAEAPA